jgi:hypothetical protein
MPDQGPSERALADSAGKALLKAARGAVLRQAREQAAADAILSGALIELDKEREARRG